MKSNDKNVLLKIGISFLLIFILFFYIGSIKSPLQFELKKSDTSSFYKLEIKDTIQKVVKSDLISDTTEKKSDTLRLKIPTEKLQENSKSKPKSVITAPGVERVLLLGDSQLEGLKDPVNLYCARNKHNLVASVIWYGSSTKNWALTDTLQYYIDVYKPTTILFAIGLNELFVRDLESREKYIKTIVAIFEKNNVKYSWIGPAAWTKDKGVIALMQNELGDLFFPSHTLTMQRASDGRHPSRNAAKKWFAIVAEDITAKGIIDFSKTLDTIPKKLKSTTILLKPMEIQ